MSVISSDSFLAVLFSRVYCESVNFDTLPFGAGLFFDRIDMPQNIKKKIAKTAFLFCILPFANTGCSNVNSSMSNITAETPHPALTNLTETLKCMGQEINKSETASILLLVDDFFDGTVPIVSDNQMAPGRYLRENGPLADGGKYDFEAVIKRSISNKKIIVPYSMPLGMMQEDKYGKINIEYLRDLAKQYNASAIIRVKGVFTQNDSSDYANKGFGSGAKTQGSHGEAELEYGVSKASKSLSLAVQLGDAFSNTVGAATTFTLNTYTESDQFSIGLNYGEGSMSFANQSKLKEGLHGAQRTLIEAAAMWALRGIYRQLDFSQCFSEKGPSPDATVSAYKKWLSLDEYERIKYLKLMLRELKYYAGKIDKRYDADLQRAINAYEVDNEMLIPHTKSNLGDIFILLYLKVDVNKIEKLSRQRDDLI